MIDGEFCWMRCVDVSHCTIASWLIYLLRCFEMHSSCKQSLTLVFEA